MGGGAGPFVVVLATAVAAAALWRRQKRKPKGDPKENGNPFSNRTRLAAAINANGMNKVVHFVRHAEATHNEAALKDGREAYLKWEHLDARLTAKGRDQCARLRPTATPLAKDIQLVVISPLSRALETAELSLEQVDNVPWLALESIRERAGSHPCDKRRTVSELRKDFPNVDFSEMVSVEEDTYWDRYGKDREDDDAIVERAAEFFEWLRKRPENNVAVVTHSAFLSVLFNEAIACTPPLQKWFENAELRSVVLSL